MLLMQPQDTASVGNMEGSRLIVRPELATSTLHLLDKEADYFCAQAVSSRHSEDRAIYLKLGESLRSIGGRVRAGESVDLMSRLESMSAGEWLIKQGVKWEVQSAHEGAAEWDWPYLADLASLAGDIEAAFDASTETVAA
jgi:hypothetical protein